MLELDGLTRRFGEVVALDGLSFAVDPGQLFGFVGPNGAGKTTAMRIVLGVLAADSGDVRWRGDPLTPATRRRIGYMPEERGLYPKMTVGRQLVYLARLHGLEEPDARRSALALVEELGVDERWEERVENLSLGNQQRVQLAAALVHRPELLVLDEPFSGLDPLAVDVLSGVLRRYADGGVPVVFSSHQLDLVEQLCDAVAIVSRGRLVASGPVRELARGTGRERFRIEVAGAPPGWVDGLAGVEVLSAVDGSVEFELEPGRDEQAVLDAGRENGRVRQFVRVEPRLVDVFRHVVER
jgi:ABC-2 type transport system ATP-binding protein